MLRKGRIKRLDDKDAAEQTKFIESPFGVAEGADMLYEIKGR
jgi:uncharacterized protein YfeS